MRKSEARYLAGRPLFEGEDSPQEAGVDLRAVILERAAAGDTAALSESHGTPFYGEALDHLLEWVRSDGSGERLTRIASFFIAPDEQLRTNDALATLVRERWLGSPSSRALPQLLRIGALSDDAGSFERSIEAAVECWRQGQLAPMTAGELGRLIDAEYWVLSDAARRSGRGNVLKQTLARLQRELAIQRGSS